MLELNKDFFFRLPGVRRRAVRTGPHSIFCYSSYSPLTLVEEDTILDTGKLHKIVQSPVTDDYFAFDPNGLPYGAVAYKVVNPVYSQKLKFVCFPIPRVFDREIHATALAYDGYIGGSNVVVGKELHEKCSFGDQIFKTNQIDDIFNDYKKFVVYSDSEYDRQLTWYNIIAAAEDVIAGYFVSKLRHDLLVREMQWARKFLTNPKACSMSALTQKEVLEQYAKFYDMNSVEFVPASKFPKWFKKNFGVDLVSVNPFPSIIKEAPMLEEFEESDKFIKENYL